MSNIPKELRIAIETLNDVQLRELKRLMIMQAFVLGENLFISCKKNGSVSYDMEQKFKNQRQDILEKFSPKASS